ncbi:MAG: hypothetical protein KGJ13_02695 [Patescibacteria group bacterium]|nr:hypothetical protein [Patescibacteria group bacterium]
MEESMQEFEKVALQRMAGLVLIPREDCVIIWSGMKACLRKLKYDPESFRKDLNESNRHAMMVAGEIIRQGTLAVGMTVELGRHVEEMYFQRLEFADKVGVRGSLLTKEIRIL